MDILAWIKRTAVQSGFLESGYLDVGDLKYYPEVRAVCEENMCRNYAASWACPPAIGTIAECRERVGKYEKMLLFSQKYDLEDSFDFEGMTEGLLDFKKRTDRFQRNLSDILSDFLLLSNEGCRRCSECTYPTAPCRFPDLLHHSLEGYGFIVHELAAEAGIRYNNGMNTVTYFGALLFNADECCSLSPHLPRNTPGLKPRGEDIGAEGHLPPSS